MFVFNNAFAGQQRKTNESTVEIQLTVSEHLTNFSKVDNGAQQFIKNYTNTYGTAPTAKDLEKYVMDNRRDAFKAYYLENGGSEQAWNTYVAQYERQQSAVQEFLAQKDRTEGSSKRMTLSMATKQAKDKMNEGSAFAANLAEKGKKLSTKKEGLLAGYVIRKTGEQAHKSDYKENS